METTYYHLDAKRLTVYDMASGEAAPQPRSYAYVRRRPKPAGEPGQVLDLEAYRRAHAGESLSQVEEDGEAEAERTCAPNRSRVRRSRFLGLTLDFCATAAILIMAVVVVVGFLPLL